jgi:hypothetical protein
VGEISRRHVRPGDPLVWTADEYNRAAEALEAFAKLGVAPPLVLSGRTLHDLSPRKFVALLSGAASPYSWTEQVRVGASWVAGARSGTSSAVEVNGKSGLGGQLAWLVPCGPGEWCFQDIRIGAATPPTTIVYPNCPCTPLPAVLAMHVVATAPCDTTVYRDCTIRWVTPVPAAYSTLALGPTGAFLSDQSFVDSAGFTFRYYLACFAAAGGQSQFDLYRVYATQPGKAATREGPRYEWFTAASGNTCHPFSLLLKGAQPLGSNSGNCVVQLTDAT